MKPKQIEQISKNIEVLQYGLYSCVNIKKASRSTVQFLIDEFSIERQDLFFTSPNLQRPMIRQTENYISVILSFPVETRDQQIKTCTVQLYIFPTIVIILHDDSLVPLRTFQEQMRTIIQEKKSPQAFSPKQLVPQLLNSLYESTLPLTHKLATEIDALEEEIFAASLAEKRLVKQLFVIERQVVDMRKILRSHEMIVSRLIELLPKAASGTAKKSDFEKLRENVIILWSNLEADVEAIDTLRDTYESLTSFYLNDILKVLTIVSMIIAPMTLIASIWGMNFNNIPLFYHEFGFAIIIVWMIVLSGLAFAYFKYKKWF